MQAASKHDPAYIEHVKNSCEMEALRGICGGARLRIFGCGSNWFSKWIPQQLRTSHKKKPPTQEWTRCCRQQCFKKDTSEHRAYDRDLYRSANQDEARRIVLRYILNKRCRIYTHGVLGSSNSLHTRVAKELKEKRSREPPMSQLPKGPQMGGVGIPTAVIAPTPPPPSGPPRKKQK